MTVEQQLHKTNARLVELTEAVSKLSEITTKLAELTLAITEYKATTPE